MQIDHAMVNRLWLEKDRSSFAKFRGPGILSNNASCIVSLLENTRHQVKAFKFYNMWMTHPNFNQLLQDNLDQTNAWITTGSTQYKLKQKLTILKKALRQLNHHNYQHIQERAKRAKQHLENIQQRGLTQGIMDEQYREARKTMDMLAQAKYLFYLQHVKHKYFKEFDRNTSFFTLW